jgi:hypothetical protein
MLLNIVKHELNKKIRHSFSISYAGIHPGNRNGQSGYAAGKASSASTLKK